MRVLAPGLKPHDLIGIVAPAGPLLDNGVLDKGLQTLHTLGFRTTVGRHALAASGYLAGSDAQRAADLMEMFSRPEVRAIVCLRGGYGTMRLLDDIDYDLIRKNPKILVGFSDITGLHLAIRKRCGLVTFHGPMVSTDFGKQLSTFTREQFLRVLTAGAGPRPITNPPDGPRPVTVTPGQARGELVGGNLTLVTALLGTPFEIETRGRILFLEEVGENPYRLDRMLSQLRLAGKLTAAAGVIFGECEDCGSGPGGQGSSVAHVLKDRLGDLGLPCFYGLAIGHGTHRATLPLGVTATMDADRHTLHLNEPAVR
ncbi:MAG: LD-carboxypeptidase [Bacillota bacterium]